VADFGTVREQQRKIRETLELPLGSNSGGGASGSHMSTKLVVGTKIYMPPEYERYGHISIKVEVTVSNQPHRVLTVFVLVFEGGFVCLRCGSAGAPHRQTARSV
jgi:hypothetical protein